MNHRGKIFQHTIIVCELVSKSYAGGIIIYIYIYIYIYIKCKKLNELSFLPLSHEI